MPTANYAWPYPTAASTVDVPRDVKALADAVDATVKGHYDTWSPWGAAVAKVPYAVHCNKVAVVDHGANGATSAAHTFPGGRFTQVPVIVCSAYASGSRLNATVSMAAAPTVNGMTIYTINLQGVTATLCSVAWWAVQMTAGAAPGVLSGPEPNIVATCHTAGCDNEELAVPLVVPPDLDGVYCGVCGQPIEDVEPTTKTKRRK